MNNISTNKSPSFNGVVITRTDRQFFPAIMKKYSETSPNPCNEAWVIKLEKSVSTTRLKKTVINVLTFWDKDFKMFNILLNKLYGFKPTQIQPQKPVTAITIHKPENVKFPEGIKPSEGIEYISNLAEIIDKSFSSKKTPILNATNKKVVDAFINDANNLTENNLTLELVDEILAKAGKEPLTPEEIKVINS
jgi:hypothetical protein